MEKLPGIDVVFFLGIGVFANIICFGCATFCRAHNKEPLLTVSMLMAFVVPLSVAYGTKYDLISVVTLQSMVSIFIGFPLIYIVYKRHKNQYEC